MSRWPKKYIIGLTGNICAGKSVVCGILENIGAQIVDADVVTHHVMKSYSPVVKDIVKEFGARVLNKKGEIDRQILGQIVFSDKSALNKLELLLHPIIRTKIEERILEGDEGVIVVEAIKLLESRLSDHCDSVWVVNASLQKRLERLVRRDNINTEDAQNRLLMQGSQELKLERADVIIENEGSLDETSVQVRYEWGKIEMPK
jgi:dephospho-CoA kinase